MNTVHTHTREGFILTVALPLFLIVAILLTAVFSYVNTARYQMADYTTATQCRLAAQTTLELAKAQLYNNFRKYYRSHAQQGLIPIMTGYWSQAAHSLQIADQCQGCQVSLKLKDLAVTTNTRKITLKLSARATAKTPFGQEVVKLLEESLEFSIEKSRVADYALFVNGPGSFGSSTQALNRYNIINGDIHANGSLNIKNPTSNINNVVYGNGQSLINGTIAASKVSREDVGSIYSNNSYQVEMGYHDTTSNDFYSDSWASYQDRKKRDTRLLAARPTSPVNSMDTSDYAQGYAGSALLQPNAAAIEMPTIDDLALYKEVATSEHATLTYRDAITGEKQTVHAIYPVTSVGPSGVVGAADSGSLLLVGTKAHPIEINGPIVVDRDVIIKGYVKGQGGLFSGRNITILGDITYVNPPQWAPNDTQVEQTIATNSTKDMLTLCAKGNVIIGCPEKAETVSFGDMNEWMALNYFTGTDRTVDVSMFYTLGVALYSNKKTFAYATDGTASDIGYGTYFNGDYLAQDGLSRVSTTETFYNPSTQTYETRVIEEPSRFCDPLISEALIKQFGTYDFSHIDATIFSNNCTMTTGRKVNLSTPIEVNGAIITRNMCLPSITGALRLNWDIRLGSESRDAAALHANTINLCLPMSVTLPKTLSWTEVQLTPEDTF